MSTTIVEMSAQERLTERFSDPRTAEALNRLLDRLDVIAFTFEALDGFLQRSPAVADSIGETLCEVRHAAGGEGQAAEFLESVPKLVRAGARLAQTTDKPEFQNLLASGLIEKLGNPRTIESLKALLDRLELAAFLLDAVDGFLRRGDEVAESVAAGVAEWREAAPGIDTDRLKALGEALPKLIDAMVSLAKSGALERFPGLLDTGMALVEHGVVRDEDGGRAGRHRAKGRGQLRGSQNPTSPAGRIAGPATRFERPGCSEVRGAASGGSQALRPDTSLSWARA